MFFVFYRSLEGNEVFLEILGVKDKSGKKLKFLPERSIVRDLRLSALALEHPRQGTSTPALAHARKGSIAVGSSAYDLRLSADDLQSNAPVHEDQLNHKPIMETFI